MNDSGFDPNDEKDPWEYGDRQDASGKPEEGGAETEPPKDGTPVPDAPSENPQAGDAGSAPGETAPRPDGENAPPEESAGQQGDVYSRSGEPAQNVGADPGADGSHAPQNGGANSDAGTGGRTPQPPYPPYGQNGAPYGRPYEPSGSPYGPYGAPYGQNGSPYGPNGGSYGPGNGAYGAPGGQHYDNPYGQPYWNYGGPYGPQPPRPPKKMGTGLKVFLWVLGVLAVGLIVGTGIYGIRAAYGRQDWEGRSSGAPSSQEEWGGTSSSASSGALIGGVEGDGTNPDTSGITIEPHPSGSELTATEVYKKVIQSVVGVQTTVAGAQNQESGTSEGTGIVASADGYILTNAHVVNYSRNNAVKVILHDNKEYAAKVVGYDKTSDIAVLKISATGLTPAKFGSVDGMAVGDRVIAIGNPGGLSFAGSLTGGYISALDRSIEEHSDNGMTYIQTDAAINPGNSGGPLVNLYGQVIGINSNKIIATGYEGMGFAIPVSRAKTIIDDLVANGYVSGRTRLGITGSSVQEMYIQIYGFPRGVLIQSVGADSDMKEKGVVQGDIITKADGTDIADMDSLYAVLNRHKPGDVIKMTVYSTSLSESAGGRKAGTTREISVRLLEDKGETQ